MPVRLPATVSADEKLARVICDSGTPKKHRNKFYYDKNDKRYVVQVGTFIDTRNPMELSVNRISTLSSEDAHGLGIAHRNEYQKESAYHGFAEVIAELCYDLNCQMKKDDVGGKKPYHANIVYPVGQKEDSQEIAVQLAFHAEFRKYEAASLG